MGVSHSVLIAEARNLLEMPLKKVGYQFEPSPPNGQWLFWFEKSLQKPKDMFYIIEFQPGGFEVDDEFFDIAVNLHRRTKREELGDHVQGNPQQIWALRLRPRFWGETGPDSGIGTRWHFISVEELRIAYKDILEKLKKYAIPFLEDPNSTWRSGMGL